MHRAIIILFLVVFFHDLRATPQIPDYLIYEGKMVELFTNPLEQYLELKGKTDIDRGCNSSACSRGYTAIWELKIGKLFLTEIKRCGIIATAGVYTGLECGENEVSEVLKYFENQFGNKVVFADWYTGKLISPQGRIINYVHMGYESTYAKERHFEIEKGVLLNTKILENEIKPEYFDLYNHNLVIDTLFHNIAKLDWKSLEEEFFCADTYSIKINKRGKVAKVWYETYFDSKWERFWYNVNDLGCRRKIKKSIKHLRFDKYLKGQKKIMTVQLNLDWHNGKLRLLN
ncbi:hypothetical protein [Spongiimicrobium sp. 2-473A-2-J]|uniref:hypothetical protein n=1 Tax=Eudoraea algarum TaxID=3417568 RepID=UPI003D36D8B9